MSGYRLGFLILSDDIAFDPEPEFLSPAFEYAEQAFRVFNSYSPRTPSVWRFDGDTWESENKFVRHGMKGRYFVSWED